VLVAVMMSGGVMRHVRMASGGRLVNGVVCRSPISRSDGLRTAHVHRGIAGNPGAESQASAALMASFVSNRAQRMALWMVARTAARSIGSSRGRYYDDAHVIVLGFCLAPGGSPEDPHHLTLCSNTATYSKCQFLYKKL
jgi:hypothetical protein